MSTCNAIAEFRPRLIVPTLRVGMPQGTLRVPALEWDAERPGLHSHAERGNERDGKVTWCCPRYGRAAPASLSHSTTRSTSC
ncbi:hypothetical protein C1X30_02195 [Pseudomonas sp. FW305-BF6]|nr:hypothetical protein C1X28_06485 [Pseudomonas sp. FW305-BF15]PNB82531.1 hypothetical protein C1X30_02195 [Pseudomonas sp. FW305-BF6]